MSQLFLLLRLYVSPLKSFSRILDEGRVLFAAIAAVAVLLAMQVPRSAEYQAERVAAQSRAVQERIMNEAKSIAAAGREDGGKMVQHAAEDEIEKSMAALLKHDSAPLTAVGRFTGADPTQLFSPLLAIAICFAPVLILVLTFWDNLGGFSTVLFRDYMPLLVCCLMAWAASYALVLVVHLAFGAALAHGGMEAALWWAGSAYFLALSALAVRTLFGTSVAHATGASAAGWLAGVSGVWLYGAFGNLTAYLASPFVLFYLYILFGGQFSGLGSGLRSRQRLKRNLELATLNPRDADAHVQLGLIYAQRRQYDAATERFRKAIEVDPEEAEAHYQLARIAREQGRYAEAVEHCRAAARINDKHSSSEVWRELGASLLLGGDAEGALAALDKYCGRHEYDPEGAIWRGRALAQLGRPTEARAAFEQAIEAVRTMPKARRRQVAQWEGEARKELKKVRS